jgi:ATP-dependent helicase/nuclease subunit B
MTSFLEEKIRHIFNHHKDEIENISIIIPNRRAGIYIQKYLSKCFKTAFFSPEILTIQDWVNLNTKERILSNTELLFILFEVHQELEGTSSQDFETFMQWGKTILADFDDIDKYLLDSEEVFLNLSSIKQLESWDLSKEEMSDEQLKFQLIWEKLPNYYKNLSEKLAKDNSTYSGKAYKLFYSRLEKISLKKHTYFLGFNAVSKVEKEIMKKMMDMKIATVIFDIDQYYFSNSDHEAGYFYRQITKEWDVKPETTNHFNQIPKKFEIIETTQQVGQAKIAGAIVENLLASGEKSKDIAVVLADETLLIPLSRSLPSSIETANITMGWPLKFSLLKGFLDIVFDMQFNFERFKSDGLYHKTLLNLIQHPFAQDLLEDKDIKPKLQEKLAESNSIFVDLHYLEDISSHFSKLEMVLKPWGKDNSMRIDVFDQLTKLFYHCFKKDSKREMDLEIIYQFNQGLKKFKNVLLQHDVDLSMRSFKMLFFQFWQNESLSFYGNPIDGLQLMGILETRTLDFKNVIIVGMNEGNLPKPTLTTSFIPRDLRLHLNLPTEEDRQAIYAHHFYRLLHRSTSIYMTYNSAAENLGNHEKSRYISQLENELDRTIHQFKSYTYLAEDEKAEISDTCYTSTAEVQDRLDTLLKVGLSPSAINKFITCPLDFYYRYILKFKEKDEVEENIESSTLGTKIHTVLQKIIEDNFKDGDEYHPLEIAVLQKENNIKSIENRLISAYLEKDGGKKFNLSDLKYGQNKLSFDVSRKFIGSFLNKQISELKSATDVVRPQFLEEKIHTEFDCKIKGEKKTIRIGGTADRIDKIGGHYRILDYKSGNSDQSKLKLSSNTKSEDWMYDLMRDPTKRNARQLLMYGLMFRSRFPDKTPFSAGIISMIKISDWIHQLKLNGEEFISDELLELFKEALIELIAEMYSEDFEFKHNPDSKYCQHCGK